MAAHFHAQIFSLLPEAHTEAEKQQVLIPCGCVTENNLVMSSQQVTDHTRLIYPGKHYLCTLIVRALSNKTVQLTLGVYLENSTMESAVDAFHCIHFKES